MSYLPHQRDGATGVNHDDVSEAHRVVFLHGTEGRLQHRQGGRLGGAKAAAVDDHRELSLPPGQHGPRPLQRVEQQLQPLHVQKRIKKKKMRLVIPARVL